jgi:alkylated DNA repair dioxygenase AlkB
MSDTMSDPESRLPPESTWSPSPSNPAEFTCPAEALPLLLLQDFVPDPGAAFNMLRLLDWERRDAPRSEYYTNDFGAPYTYGRGAGQRTYQPKPMAPWIRRIRDLLEEKLGATFEVCFLNLYGDQRQHLGWHADDSPEMDDARPIVSVSLGAVRDIQVRPKMCEYEPGGQATDQWRSGSGPPSPTPCRKCGDPHDHPRHWADEPPPPTTFTLGHGSAFVMPPGFQDRWQHRIPKSSKICGERISLTFRGYVRCPCGGFFQRDPGTGEIISYVHAEDCDR